MQPDLGAKYIALLLRLLLKLQLILQIQLIRELTDLKV
jgi:hypothetical protein